MGMRMPHPLPRSFVMATRLQVRFKISPITCSTVTLQTSTLQSTNSLNDFENPKCFVPIYWMILKILNPCIKVWPLPIGMLLHPLYMLENPKSLYQGLTTPRWNATSPTIYAWFQHCPASYSQSTLVTRLDIAWASRIEFRCIAFLGIMNCESHQ